MNNYIIAYVVKKMVLLIIILWSVQCSYGRQEGITNAGRLKLELARGAFHESYQLILHKDGSDAVDDADALQLSEGFVVLAGLTSNGTRLSIDERHTDTVTKRIRLYTKGWEAGTYTLSFSAQEEFFDAYRLTLIDQHLQVYKDIGATDTVYVFYIGVNKDTALAGSRFVLLLEPKNVRPQSRLKEGPSIAVYPNPFSSKLYINGYDYDRPFSITIRDFKGSKLWGSYFDITRRVHEVYTAHFAPGLYLVELLDKSTGQRITSLKVIKL